MLHIRDKDRDVEEWRAGVRTRMLASARNGAGQLTVFEQWCDPGHGAPRHVHAVEEVLRVLAGEARIFVGKESAAVVAGESVIVPAGVEHGFTNERAEILHTMAILAAPVFEAEYIESGISQRRWAPEG